MTSIRAREREATEQTIAKRFLELFNRLRSTQYRYVGPIEHDPPDVRCQDPAGRILDLEITRLEDFRGQDLKWLGGRGEKPKGRWGTGARGFSQDTLDSLVSSLRKKLRIQCGPQTALVFYQISPLWASDAWEGARPVVAKELRSTASLFLEGIWVVCAACDGDGHALVRLDQA
jgi:hypothetical protein